MRYSRGTYFNVQHWITFSTPSLNYGTLITFILQFGVYPFISFSIALHWKVLWMKEVESSFSAHYLDIELQKS